MTKNKKNSKSLIAGILTSAAASLCCITPIIAILGGASGLASSFSWIESFRPYLIGVTLWIFGSAWYQKMKMQKHEDCKCETDKTNSFLDSKTFLSILTILAALLITFPYYSKALYLKGEKPQCVVISRINIIQAEFKINGMTCESCTEHVNSELAKVKGVVQYKTSYERGNSIVKFDNSKTSVDSIVKSINKIGYKVISQTVINN
ncbi:MAG: mercuric transport protein MerTP [Chitinophagaceae bacterium]|nr:mercuric transport protein MerTP [Chitinophagaceae bacterium]